VTSARLGVEISGEKKVLNAVRFSMMPEVDNRKRCVLSLRESKDGRKLSLLFSAKDLVALRAGLNTNLRLVSSALKTIETTSKIEKKDYFRNDHRKTE
jgi:tRNA threonylcarbamoyladenosine modification (KEOPS) complex  Pcc1 subunit